MHKSDAGKRKTPNKHTDGYKLSISISSPYLFKRHGSSKTLAKYLTFAQKICSKSPIFKTWSVLKLQIGGWPAIFIYFLCLLCVLQRYSMVVDHLHGQTA